MGFRRPGPGRKPIDRSGTSRVDTLPDGTAELLRKNELHTGMLLDGRYRLKEFLGEGAMGTVFVAENEAINLTVAVKLLRAEVLANSEFRRRFQKEAEAVAAVRHPNVARFYDLVVGNPTFLVMEYVTGQTLAQALSNGPLAVDRAVRIAARLCWGLDAAHTAGVIHRDLKPANIVLEPDREHGESPKIIDFGLAKMAASANASQLTRQGQIVGTPHYMSPEQISGGEVDTRSDIYGLACVLYEMLTGEVPFVGVDSDVQVLYRQVHEPAGPPSRLNPKVSAELDRLLLRALAKRPEDRFSDIRELARALDRELLRLETEAEAEPEPEPAPAPPRRWPWIATALVAAVIGAATGFVLRRPAAPAVTGSASGATPQALLVVSRPAGAQVEIDDTPLPQTTPTWAAGLAPGSHRVRVEKAGYGAEERTVRLADGQRDVVDVALAPPVREIIVHTVPDGAALFLDGRLVSNATPATVRLDADFHQLRAELLGYEVATRNLAPEDTDTEITIRMEVERLPRGIITVDSRDTAAVLIDGAETGFHTPTLGIYVPLGEHTVALRDSAGHQSEPVKVTVAQGQVVRMTLNLER